MRKSASSYVSFLRDTILPRLHPKSPAYQDIEILAEKLAEHIGVIAEPDFYRHLFLQHLENPLHRLAINAAFAEQNRTQKKRFLGLLFAGVLPGVTYAIVNALKSNKLFNSGNFLDTASDRLILGLQKQASRTPMKPEFYTLLELDKLGLLNHFTSNLIVHYPLQAHELTLIFKAMQALNVFDAPLPDTEGSILSRLSYRLIAKTRVPFEMINFLAKLLPHLQLSQTDLLLFFQHLFQLMLAEPKTIKSFIHLQQSCLIQGKALLALLSFYQKYADYPFLNTAASIIERLFYANLLSETRINDLSLICAYNATHRLNFLLTQSILNQLNQINFQHFARAPDAQIAIHPCKMFLQEHDLFQAESEAVLEKYYYLNLNLIKSPKEKRYSEEEKHHLRFYFQAEPLKELLAVLPKIQKKYSEPLAEVLLKKLPRSNQIEEKKQSLRRFINSCLQSRSVSFAAQLTQIRFYDPDPTDSREEAVTENVLAQYSGNLL